MIWSEKDLHLLSSSLNDLHSGFSHLPSETSIPNHRTEAILSQVAERMKDNYPYFHSRYMGQMLKPPHPVAAISYAMAMMINPNNHALDGGKASSEMEKEVIVELARMFGWESALGHLCSGGTMANLEALWIAGQSRPGKRILASRQAHYTHSRVCSVLQLPFATVECDPLARMDVQSLEKELLKNDVGTVVVTLGTTASGSVDPLSEILKLREKFGFRIHIDSAYGGYFRLASNLSPEASRSFALMQEADSIVIDPHKHGLQPYGCGCVLFRDSSVGKFYKHDSPYTYFTSGELHLGEITLECSRPGAAAVALWATQKLLPLVPGGEFAGMLESTRRAALKLASFIQSDDRWRLAFVPELDIVVWAPRRPTSTETSALSKKLFALAEEQHLYLALARFPRSMLQFRWTNLEWREDEVTCLRACCMKPIHELQVESNWKILNQIMKSIPN